MKKWFKLFAALCLAAVLCVPLAACEWGSESGGSENGGSENGGNSGDPSAVRTTVTEEEWNKAMYESRNYFMDDPDANVTIVVSSSGTGPSGEDFEYGMEYQVDGNKIYNKIYAKLTLKGSAFGMPSEELSEEVYLEILSRSENADGGGTIIADVYSMDANGNWTVTQDETSYGLSSVTGVTVDPYEQVNLYENFTYNQTLQRYEVNDLVVDLSDIYAEMGIETALKYTFEYVAVQFENGNVVRREEQVIMEMDGMVVSVTGSTTYSYGTASVILPQVSLPQAEE